jgi:hypothetical protein
MSVHPTITVRQPSQRRWLVAAIASVVIAGVVAAALAFAFRGGSSTTNPNVNLSSSPAAQDARKVPSIFSLTPMRLASGALGTGYVLPTAQQGPSLESVLASMDPQTRRYTESIMALTFTQLAAGAAGQP